MGEELKPAKPPRALALDALRGLAILGMCLSGRLPFGKDHLPAWMYHAQLPPPHHSFKPEIPGFTWVDLVFPLFLFSMGAAFPFALRARLESGKTVASLLPGILLRGVSLMFFAVYIQNITPTVMNSSPTGMTYFLSFLGLVLLFPIYLRYPKSLSKNIQIGLRVAGVIVAVTFMLYLGDERLSRGAEAGPDFIALLAGIMSKYDIIIMVLANMAITGSIVWLITRDRPDLRILSLALVFALLEANKISGSWVQKTFSPPSFSISGTEFTLGWFTNLAWQKYLFIVVPGTLIGDQLLKWMRARESGRGGGWSGRKLGGLALAVFGLVVFLHIALQARWVFVATAVSIAAGIALWFWVRSASQRDDAFLRTLVIWGAFWLVLGLFFEPVHGGIKKDPSNMSYYFVTTGMSILLLLAFTVWIDLFGWRRAFGFIIAPGQNPMIAYAGIRSFLTPLVNGLGLETVALKIFQGPWLRFVWGVIKTGILAGFVAVFTRLRIFWRT